MTAQPATTNAKKITARPRHGRTIRKIELERGRERGIRRDRRRLSSTKRSRHKHRKSYVPPGTRINLASPISHPTSCPLLKMQNPPTLGASARRTYRGPFAIMTVLFFMWGFMTVFNDILIPRFKEAFTLDYFHAMLVQLSFFGAYFVGSLIYFIISATSGDPIARIGYKNGVVIGLLISAVGSALFWPAANLTSYPMFLAGLFIVGLGFA